MTDARDIHASENSEVSQTGVHPANAWTLDLLENRRSVSPLRLTEPGPDSGEIRRMLSIAMRVPDHGALEPWRLIVVEGQQREELGRKLTAVFLETAPEQMLTTADLAGRKIRAMFTAAPVIIIVVSCTDSAARIPEWEQILSAGAVCMNLITAASALGYGATWLTGWAAYDPGALKLLGITSREKVAGIVPIGKIAEHPRDRARPSLATRVTTWARSSAAQPRPHTSNRRTRSINSASANAFSFGAFEPWPSTTGSDGRPRTTFGGCMAITALVMRSRHLMRCSRSLPARRTRPSSFIVRGAGMCRRANIICCRLFPQRSQAPLIWPATNSNAGCQASPQTGFWVRHAAWGRYFKRPD